MADSWRKIFVSDWRGRGWWWIEEGSSVVALCSSIRSSGKLWPHMSWDIFVRSFPSEAKSVDEIPEDFRSTPIGRRSELIKAIQTMLPTADFSDPEWGVVDGPDWSIEVSLGSEEICDGFALHVRGGDEAVGAVAAILEAVKLRGVDSQTGDFFVAGEESRASFRRWRAYRDQIAESR